MTNTGTSPSVPILGIAQAEEFKCIGPDCQDTCCAGWGVSIDKFTFEKWRKSDNPSNFTKHLKIIETIADGDLDKAEVILDAKGSCPFLEASKLCSIQNTYGHDFLSYVCRSFPRSQNSFFGIHEENLSLACPEAARLILSASNPLEINLRNHTEDSLSVVKITAPLQEELFSIESSVAWQLRALILQIIQKREVSLAQRLIIIGMLASNLDQYISKKVDKNEAFKNVIEKYFEIVNSPNTINALTQSIQKSPNTKILFLQTLINVISPFANINQNYNRYFLTLKKVFKLDDKTNQEEILENYLTIRANFLDNHKSNLILENYTYHLFLKELFPFQNLTCFSQFQDIALRIYLIQEHLMAITSDLKESIEEDSIVFIQKFTKIYEHSGDLQRRVKAITESTNFNSLAHICILLGE